MSTLEKNIVLAVFLLRQWSVCSRRQSAASSKERSDAGAAIQRIT